MGQARGKGEGKATPPYPAQMQLPANGRGASPGGGALPLNGGFETGDFTSWIVTDIASPFIALGVGTAGFSPGFGFFTSAPTEGTFAALHGFDGGGPDTISLAQDVALASNATTVTFDYRAAWDLLSFCGGCTLDRTFEVRIEPAGGGGPLQTDLILTAAASTINLDTGPLSGSVDVSAFAGSTVRVNFLWTIPESFTGPAFFQLDNVKFPLCGNGNLDDGEECDDGNNASFDNCSDICENEQPQSKTQRGCIVDMNKNVAKVAKAQGKDICKCIKDGAKGKLVGQTIEECLTSDGKGKVAKAKGKLEDKVAKSCTTDPNSPAAPGFGAETPPDPNFHSQAAIEAELGLIHWIFGSDLDSVIVKQSDPNVPNAKENSKCQLDVAKAAKKCFDTKWKVFNKCKKDALKGKNDPAVGNPTQLVERCLGTGTDPIPDPGGKVQKDCNSKLEAKINSKCAPPVDLAQAFPGYDPNASDLRSFVDFMVECEFCKMVNAVDSLKRRCDLFDDGLANASCTVCGNGLFESGEECDDGNDQDSDACSPSCRVCSHDKCATGAPLADDCDPCVAQICQADPFCCSVAWDSVCQAQVSSVCGFDCFTCNNAEDLTTCDPAVTDTWEFSVTAGQFVAIQADTVDAPTAADLFFSGDCAGIDFFFADDTFACTFPPPAFSCPQTSFTATATGTCTVEVSLASSACADPNTANYCFGVLVDELDASPLLTLDDQ